MRLIELNIKNFRCFKNETIPLSAYNAFVGANNSGKSTVLKAIDAFFRSTPKRIDLRRVDFNDVSQDLEIRLKFFIDNDNERSVFEHYVRQREMTFLLRAKIENDGSILGGIFGLRRGMQAFAPFHSSQAAADKKALYRQLREQFQELPQPAGNAAVSVYEAALVEYEASHQNDCVLIESGDQAFGAMGVVPKLRNFIDWVYIPAVKDAAGEYVEAKNTAFGRLVDRVVRSKVHVDEKIAELQELAHDKIEELKKEFVEVIGDLQTQLDQEFKALTSTSSEIKIEWQDEAENRLFSIQLPQIKSSLDDGTFAGDVSNFGHGLQRNYLIALIHLTARLNAEGNPTILLACEEPELYQHPPQARHLHSALRHISENAQVLITTHSPYFVSADTFESVKVIRKNVTELSKVSYWTFAEHGRLIAQTKNQAQISDNAVRASLAGVLQPELNELFFCPKLVLVEGAEDRALMQTVLHCMGVYNEFVRLGGHIVCSNGKSGLLNLLALARGFQIHYYVIFDADTDCGRENEADNKKQNAEILRMIGVDDDNVHWPDATVIGENYTVWRDNIQTHIREEFAGWDEHLKQQCVDIGWTYQRLKKNPVLLALALKSCMEKNDMPRLIQVGTKVMEFAV